MFRDVPVQHKNPFQAETHGFEQFSFPVSTVLAFFLLLLPGFTASNYQLQVS